MKHFSPFLCENYGKQSFIVTIINFVNQLLDKSTFQF